MRGCEMRTYAGAVHGYPQSRPVSSWRRRKTVGLGHEQFMQLQKVRPRMRRHAVARRRRCRGDYKPMAGIIGRYWYRLAGSSVTWARYIYDGSIIADCGSEGCVPHPALSKVNIPRVTSSSKKDIAVDGISRFTCACLSPSWFYLVAA